MTAIDLIVRLKNGYMSSKDNVVMPCSAFTLLILEKLKKLKYISDYQVQGETIKEVTVQLRYVDAVPAISDIKVFSKPGRRWYTSYTELTPVLDGMGRSFISTSQGILTDTEAKKRKAGGELLFQIW